MARKTLGAGRPVGDVVASELRVTRKTTARAARALAEACEDPKVSLRALAEVTKLTLFAVMRLSHAVTGSAVRSGGV